MQFVRVGRSSLHGQGVFAVVLLPARTLLGEYIGELLFARPRDCRFVVRVTVDEVTGHYHFVDARDPAKSNFTRYLNDPGPGQMPNCQFLQSDLSVEVWTIRTIQPGEELTLQYMDWATYIGRSRPQRNRRRVAKWVDSSDSESSLDRTQRGSQRAAKPNSPPGHPSASLNLQRFRRWQMSSRQ